MGEASRGKIGFARGDLLEGTIGQAEVEVTRVVQRLRCSREKGGTNPYGESSSKLRARLAPILHGVGNRLEEALG